MDKNIVQTESSNYDSVDYIEMCNWIYKWLICWNCSDVSKSTILHEAIESVLTNKTFDKQANRAYGMEISPKLFVISFVILLYAISYNICI